MANLGKTISKRRNAAIRVLSLVCVASFAAGFCVDSFKSADGSTATGLVQSAGDSISKLNTAIETNREDYYDPNVIYQLPETVEENQEISVIVSMDTESVIDSYFNTQSTLSVGEYAVSHEAQKIEKTIAKERTELLRTLNKSGVSYKLGVQYDTVLSGFELVIKGKDYAKVGNLLGDSATLILSETYEPAVTEVVENEVDVYETGIFNSANSMYQGDGVVVAVLDSGLDYTHSVFDVSHFDLSKKRFSSSDIADKLGDTAAAGFTAGLTAEDVYLSDKIPFAYDYADKDADVLPTNSDHGTHVSGIIAGRDDSDNFVGVAPNAQIAFMKVFSDRAEGAKDSWILAALEDCIRLEVDVINMSLGSGCGFTTERSELEKHRIYDLVKETGISLIVSAANSYNSTMGSEKNGNLGLTSNPDSGTVGAPSTYDAALSIASVDGVKTPYLTYNGEIIYFNEATNARAETKKFVDEILATVGDNVTSHDFEYVTIGGTGALSDYVGNDYSGKIVLVKRGVTTFEEKIKVALLFKGAAGIIIYNNVSGDISMSVGNVTGAACSISQDDGEMLAKAKTGTIHVSKEQVAGPFMSDFSSWGPTSDLKIKPEITSHGGEIYSSIPGQKYERQSGTSMAAPNLAGAAALIRQYVKYNTASSFGTTEELESNPVKVTNLVNQLMMSTADIVMNKNGLPYAVRKQGSGLINIGKATTTASYITTYDVDGNAMDKTKFELGDDKDMDGVYEMTFDVNNISTSSVVYDIGAIVMTEGVSETYTSHDELTVTQDGYLLDGAKVSVVSVNGSAHSGTKVTVGAKASVNVTVKIELNEADKQYLKESFANGMYVEGFLTLDAVSGTDVDISAPFLAFFGDWSKAPIFDEEYYDTHKDEIDAGIDAADKLMADAYATRVIGGLYSDYIATMGVYYFVQDPSASQIAASKDHIAMSNQENEYNPTISSIHSVSAGILRNVREVLVTITEDSTGRTVFEQQTWNQRKSFSSGSSIYASSIDLDFDTMSNNLKNNTRYTVTVTTYIDYGENEDQNNTRNTFTFPLYIDFESPVITDVTYRTEYDKNTQKARLYADLNVYDNHYAMGMQIGQIIENPDRETEEDPLFSLSMFGKYVTPVYSSFNSTTKVTLELTDYIEELKRSAVTIAYDENGEVYTQDTNSFVAVCYDYALNSATYEIRLPDEILAMYFTTPAIELSPNETKTIDESLLSILPGEKWLQTLEFESSDPSVVSISAQTIVAKKSGTATITVKGYDDVALKVTVLGENDPGYQEISLPQVSKFTLTGYKTNKAYYSVSNDEREIGLTDGTYDFDKDDYTLSMFPSESVTLISDVQSAFLNDTLNGNPRVTLSYSSGDEEIAVVDEKTGEIVAKAEGSVSITVKVLFDGKQTVYSETVSVTVKDPFTTNSIYLMSYKGNGGTVTIPDDRGITTIYSYAFSNYEFVPKDLEAGDVIDDEDPYEIKQWFLGEDTITSVIIPEGVTTIEAYAFAGLTALTHVKFPTTLRRIGVGAFYGCTNLKTLEGIEYVQFIGERGFYDCDLRNIQPDQMKEMVAIGDYAFQNCNFSQLRLSEKTQSIGIGAFCNNVNLSSLIFDASKVKVGASAFESCKSLVSVEINAAVISAGAFRDCKALSSVKLGSDVAVIGEYAFSGTNVASFEVDYRNDYLEVVDPSNATETEKGPILYKYEKDGEGNVIGKELIVCAPMYAGNNKVLDLGDATKIGTGAFAGNEKIFKIIANNVTSIGAYAFTGCTMLEEVYFDKVTTVSDYAFYHAAITMLPDLSNITSIGKYAFANTNINSVNLTNEADVSVTVGDYAFSNCEQLTDVTIGNNVTLGKGAFQSDITWYDFDEEDDIQTLNYKLTYYYTEYEYTVEMDEGEKVYTYLRYDLFSKNHNGVQSKLKTVQIGNNVQIGDNAFEGNARLTDVTFGENVTIGNYAFYNNVSLTSEKTDLKNVVSIGEYAFSGETKLDLYINNRTIENAYVKEFIDGELVNVSYKTTTYASALQKADLSAARSIGAYAFSYGEALTEVILGEGLEAVADYAFAYCPAISTIELPSTVTVIGDYAFHGTALTSLGGASLSNVSTLGEYALAYTKLTSVTLKEGVTIGKGAFYDCELLAETTNLDKAVSIGDYAFYQTAVSNATLTSATYVGQYAFGYSNVTSVTLSDNVKSLGDNPFVGCAIQTYGRTYEEEFNGEKYSVAEDTYDVNDTVKVIGGVLYQVLPNGNRELVSYPIANEASGYTVEEGTARIAAGAFAESKNLQYVTLASTLAAIGDKAFYGCEKLSVVVFQSYNAPDLEGEYNVSYLTYYNLPFTGSLYNGYDTFEGLGVSPFYMWNAASSPTTFYFGANFVDYIGKVTDKLVMVKPVNGQNYTSFIFSQYFDTFVDGRTAAVEATLNAIAKIAEIPDFVTLDSESVVIAAREAYNLITSMDQQALVTNYRKLTDAESKITYLKSKGEPTNPGGNTGGSEEEDRGWLSLNAGAWFVIGGITLVFAAYVVLDKVILKRRNNQKKD